MELIEVRAVYGAPVRLLRYNYYGSITGGTRASVAGIQALSRS